MASSSVLRGPRYCLDKRMDTSCETATCTDPFLSLEFQQRTEVAVVQVRGAAAGGMGKYFPMKVFVTDSVNNKGKELSQCNCNNELPFLQFSIFQETNNWCQFQYQSNW